MGVVYQAHDPQIDRTIALKVLRQDRVTSKEYVNRFLKEAMAIGRLSHPNIVTIYDVGQDHDTIYIAMEFLEGRPFDEVIKEKKLRIKHIVNIGIQVAEALAYAHEKGVIHRDIKPSNIIFTADNQVKITDFGIARIEDPLAIHQTQAGEILGTPVYMSPEQVRGQKVDGRSDIYSLGIILYEMATGKRPFAGNNIAAIFASIIQDNPLAPVKITSDISHAQSDLIMKCLAKDPENRFQTGKKVSHALTMTLTEDPAKITSKGQIEKQPTKRSGTFIFTGIIFISIAAGFLYYFFYLKDSKPPVSHIIRNFFINSEDIKTSRNKLHIKKSQGEMALLKIETMPEGAGVFIDNLKKGTTPLNLELPLGKYEVRLSLHEYYEWIAQVKLEKKGETPVFIKLVPFAEKKDHHVITVIP